MRFDVETERWPGPTRSPLAARHIEHPGCRHSNPAAVKMRRRNALMARQKKIVARAQRARIGTEVPLLIDGPSAEHEMVVQGRLEGQAPDIDAVVYLTDCDASQLKPGDLIQARIVAARGYDLVAAPLIGAAVPA